MTCTHRRENEQNIPTNSECITWYINYFYIAVTQITEKNKVQRITLLLTVSWWFSLSWVT